MGADRIHIVDEFASNSGPELHPIRATCVVCYVGWVMARLAYCSVLVGYTAMGTFIQSRLWTTFYHRFFSGNGL